ncbi:MAG: prefoldin domain-containing protein, partial [candidate division WOR-3 bacterium]
MKKLKEFKKYLILIKFLENFFVFLSIFIVFLVICILLKINFYFSFISLLSFIYFLYFLRNINYFKIARKIERKIPELDEKIITYLEFKDSKKEKERKIAERLENFFEKFEFKRVYPLKNLLEKIRIFVYSFLYSALIFSLFPYKFAEYYLGIKSPNFYLKIEPLKGTFFVPLNLNIKGLPFGEKEIERVFIEYKINKDKKIDEMKKVENHYIYTINIFEPCTLKYRIKANGFKSREGNIIFKERPFLKSWKVFFSNDTLYSPEKIFTFDSKFKILFNFSGDFDSGYIFINDENFKKFYRKDIEVFFEKKEGFLNFVYFVDDKKIDEMQRIEIRRVLDEKPFIYVIYPPSDDKINEDMKIPFVLYLMDDFSLQSLDLFLQFKEIYSKRIKNYKNQKEDTVFYILDISHLSLLPGDTILVWFKLEDRGLDGSSRSSKSRIYKFWVPTYFEIYKETEREMEEGISFLKGEGKEVSDFYRDLKNIQEKIENLKERKEFGEIKETIEEMEKSIERLSSRFEEYSEKISELLKRYP